MYNSGCRSNQKQRKGSTMKYVFERFGRKSVCNLFIKKQNDKYWVIVSTLTDGSNFGFVPSDERVMPELAKSICQQFKIPWEKMVYICHHPGHPFKHLRAIPPKWAKVTFKPAEESCDLIENINPQDLLEELELTCKIENGRTTIHPYR